MKKNSFIRQAAMFLPTVIVLVIVIVSLKINQEAEQISGSETVTINTTSETVMETEVPTTIKNSETKAKETTTVQKSVETPYSVSIESSEYRDGTYYGTGQGFAGQITVKVVISNGKIISAQIVETTDDKAYIQKASVILNKFVSNNNGDIDTVSGATYSSKGIIEALQSALSKAKTVQDNNQTQTTAKQQETTKTKNRKLSFSCKDGIYYGKARGFRGETQVAVVVENNQIKYIMVISTDDDKKFVNKAKNVITDIVAKQSTKVDTVSGATYSSNGIINAVKAALNSAKKGKKEKETTTVNNQTTTVTVVEPEENKNILNDGTYTASAICYPDDFMDFQEYDLNVTVVIKDGKISSITNVKGSGKKYINAHDWYIKRAINGTTGAPGISAQLLNRTGTSGIDTVSGATCSSDAIIEAVGKALENAKKQ